MVLAMKAAGVLAAAAVGAAGGGMTIAHLAREMSTVQRQVTVLRREVRLLDRSALAYGLRFGNGRQLVCIRVQAPEFSRHVGILPAYKCVPSG